MLDISAFIDGFNERFQNISNIKPWEITGSLASFIESLLPALSSEFRIAKAVAIHRTATVESGATINGPAVISEGCFVAATAYLRGGIYIGKWSTIGPGCEVKSCIMMDHSVAAHLNFIGDSIIGSDVNFEAGSITANHYNDRVWKEIMVVHDSKVIETHSTKFGSLIGDHCRIGANAVLSPGTILKPATVINRLALVDQLALFQS